MQVPKDESTFDTMRLIAGVESSGLYSLEEILQEFSPEQQEPETMESLPDFDLPPEPQPAEEEPPEELSEPETLPEQTDAEIADVIAQAIAASFQPQDHPAPEPEKDEPPAMHVPEKTEPEAEAPKPQPSPAEQSPAEQPPAKQPPREKPKKKASKKQEPSEPETAEKPSEASAKKGTAIPNVKTVEVHAKQEETVRNPGAKQKKIPKSHVHVGFVEVLGLMIGDLRSRQRASLPPNKTSLKAAEKSNAFLARIGSVLAPVRYIILVLMAFALLGRKFSWMTLGFLGGSTGATVAMVLTVAAMVMAWQSLLRALKDILYLRFSYETILLLTTVLSLAETATQKNEATLLPLLAIAWCVSGTAAWLTTRANLRSLRAVITGRSRKGVRLAENKWEHTDCIGKTSASTAGFVRRQEESDTWHSGWSAFGWLLVAICLIVSAYLTARTEGNYLTILVTLLTVSMPVSLCLCCARPYELLSRAMNGAAAVAGWFGIRAMSGKKAILIYDEDLFPKGTIGHKGVKIYGKQTPKLLTSYAASLVLRADNGLSEVFTRLLKETGGTLYDVSYFQTMDAGLVGRINGVLVAVGTYHFMHLMGSMPPPNAPKNGIFIAINGEVAGVFAIKYRVRASAAEGFERLERDRSLTTLLATRNFCVNPSFVEIWFQMPVSEVTCPKLETRCALSEPSLFAHGITCGYVMKEGITAYSRMVAGSRRVYRMGLFMTVLSVVLSLAMLVLMAVQIATGTVTLGGAQLILVQLVLLAVLEIGARLAVR